MKIIYVGFVVIVAYSIAMINFDDLSWWLSPKNVSYRNHKTQVSSSIWCHVLRGNTICTFQNVCYRPKENQFIFLLTESSIIVGLESKEDLQRIKLSSVLNHNVFFMNVVMMQNDGRFKIENFSSDALFLLWRFKWDNVMHVIHDDILPLYLTYLDTCKDVDECISKYTLGFVDKGERGPFIDLYKLFSKKVPILLRNIKTFVCYKEVQAGLLSDTVWFQYGFGKPHGPVKSNLSVSVLHNFRKYIFSKYISPKKRNNNTIIFLNRNLNRRILNKNLLESTMVHTMREVYPLSKPSVLELDLSTHNLKSILQAFSTSSVVVGMHGSAMILCLFLDPGSVVIEMFPFGIEPEHVSYLRAFSRIKGTGIIYRSWINTNESNSVPHPEAPELLGGIHHLPLEKQKIIMEVKKVPAVECCHNPMYLYRMFQDTVVHSNVKDCFLDALTEQMHYSETTFATQYFKNILTSWYYPSHVEDVSCFIKKKILSISWQAPINSLFLLTYDIAFILDNHDSYSTNTQECSIQIKLDQNVQSAKVWIKAVSQYGEGIDVYSLCQENS